MINPMDDCYHNIQRNQQITKLIISSRFEITEHNNINEQNINNVLNFFDHINQQQIQYFMRNQQKIREYKQQRHQFLIQKIQQLEMTLILFQNGYISEDSEKKNQHDLISNDIYDKVKKIRAFLDSTKNIIQQEDLLAFQTQASIQNTFDYMEAMLTNQIKLYKEKQQFQNDKEGTIRGHKFSRKANLILKQWLCDHFQYPYPLKEDLIQLSQKCKLTFKQCGSLTVEEELVKRPTMSINIRILSKKSTSIQRVIDLDIRKYLFIFINITITINKLSKQRHQGKGLKYLCLSHTNLGTLEILKHIKQTDFNNLLFYPPRNQDLLKTLLISFFKISKSQNYKHFNKKIMNNQQNLTIQYKRDAIKKIPKFSVKNIRFLIQQEFNS
ncbi:homeodomain superfamily [Paramecium bursaria]